MKILIVDDTPTNIDILIEYLEIDYELLIAVDGLNALEILKKETPDLILLDIMMPKMDGFTTCTEIKKDSLKKDIPIIFLTAKSDMDSLSRGFEVGGVDYITKPFNSIELKARIKTHLKLKNYQENLEKIVKTETKKRLKQEKILIQNEKMAQMGQMIGAITHQWKQPLNVVGIIVQDMLLAYKDNDLDSEYMEDSVKSMMTHLEFMSQTTRNFQNFFKPDKLNRKFNLKAEIESVFEMLKPQLRIKNISINIDVDENLSLKGSVNEFKQVIVNFVNNSIDAFDGSVDIDAVIEFVSVIEDEKIYLKFRDNAGGIDSKMFNVLFKEYESSKGDRGTGIGLALCKTIIEEHFNGKIRAYNENNGAVFEIILNLKDMR